MNNSTVSIIKELQQYKKLFKESKDIILFIKLDGQILEANQAAINTYGYSKKEFLLMTIHDLRWPAESKSLTISQINQACNESIKFETIHRRKNGNTFPVEVSSHSVIISNQKILLSIIRNLPDRQKTLQQESLRNKVMVDSMRISDSRFRSFFKKSNLGMIIKDKEGIILESNPAFQKMLGYTEKELIAMNIKDLTPHEDIAKSISLYNKLTSGKIDYYELDKRYIKKDGTILYAHLIAYISRDIVNNSQFIISFIEDITEKKSLKKNIEISEMRFKTIFEEISIGIAINDIEGNILTCNQALADILGYSIDELSKMKFTHFTHPEDLGKEQYLYDELIKRKRNQYWIEKRYIRKNGQVIWVDVKVSTNQYTNQDGKFIITFVENINERKMYEQEMARLDRLNLVGELAASLSHEVRNPITTVRGFIKLLGCKEQYATDKHYFDLMVDELDRANTIIQEFLSTGKLKHSQLKKQSLNDIIKTMEPLIQSDALTVNKKINIKLNETPELLLDDKEIRQVILNLVRNGLEAMESGGNINISTYVEGNKVILKVQDEGKGIPSEVFNKLGTPFFTTKEKGTGLGLATTFSIIKRHNGNIDIDSNSKGTIFYIKFVIS